MAFALFSIERKITVHLKKTPKRNSKTPTLGLGTPPHLESCEYGEA
jgi:hypothetical protein